MKKLSTLCFTLLLVVTTFAQATAINAVKNKEVTQYLDLSGIELMLQNIPMQIQGMGQQMKLTAKDPEHAEATMNILVDAWDENQVKESIKGKIKNGFSVKEMKALLTWLNTDLARNVKIAEQKSASANFNQEFMQYMAKIQSTPPTAERVKTIRNFVDSTNMIEHAFDMVMSISKGMVKSMHLADGKTISDEEINQQMQKMESMLKPQLAQQMIYVSYYMYEELSDEDISAYAKFYDKPLGQKELKVVYQAIGDSFGLWTEQAGKTLQAQIKK